VSYLVSEATGHEYLFRWIEGEDCSDSYAKTVLSLMPKERRSDYCNRRHSSKRSERDRNLEIMVSHIVTCGHFVLYREGPR
jgi:hypothetical protein